MTIRKQVFVINDNFTFFQSIKKSMPYECINADYTKSAMDIVDTFEENEYCLIIICVQEPANRCLEILHLLRKRVLVPIIMIAEKLNVSEKISIFHAGANICLEKPLDFHLFAAQASALVQLYLNAKDAIHKNEPLMFGTELIINPFYRYVIIDGEPLELTRTEFDLLYYMANHPKQIFSRQQLYRQIWGDDLGINGENTVRSHIGNLYKKLADVGKNYIQNTRGVGYKFVPPAGKE